MNKKQTYWTILFFCIIKLCLHLIADFNSGFSNDEFLHIETGNHPALGYMEFPPIIGWLAYIQNSFDSTSVYVYHIFPHIASLLILIILALSVAELGGKTKAVFFALLCMLFSPGLEMSQQLFQPVVFSQLFWVLSFYQLSRWVKTSDQKYFLYLMLSLALGFLTKYDIIFFIAGLTSLIFFAKTRSALLTLSNVKYILLLLLLIAPNIFWQYQHGYPVLHMFSRLYETQLDKLSPIKVVLEIVIALNPFVFIVVLAGIVALLGSGAKEVYRPVGLTVILSVFAHLH